MPPPGARAVDAIRAFKPINRHGRRLRKRNLAVRNGLRTFLEFPAVPADHNRSVGTTVRRGMDAYHAILAVLSRTTILGPD